jgi:cell division protein FtsB
MAPARNAARTRTPPASAAKPLTRPTLIRGHGGKGIRWDRVGRVALLVVLCGVVALYVGPSISFVQTWGQARVHRDEVRQLRHENQRLKARRAALLSRSTLEREARRLGLVKPGERPYVVQDLPGG